MIQDHGRDILADHAVRGDKNLEVFCGTEAKECVANLHRECFDQELLVGRERPQEYARDFVWLLRRSINIWEEWTWKAGCILAFHHRYAQPLNVEVRGLLPG